LATVAAGQRPAGSLDEARRSALQALAQDVAAQATARATSRQRAGVLMGELQTALAAVDTNQLPDGQQNAQKLVSDLQAALQKMSADQDHVLALQRMDQAAKIILSPATTVGPATPPVVPPPVATPDGLANELRQAKLADEGGGPILTTGGLSFGVWILNPLANLSVSCRYRHGQGIGDIALCTEGTMPPAYMYHVMIADAGIAILHEEKQKPVELGRVLYPFQPGQWYDLTVRILPGGRISVDVAGKQVLSVTDPQPLPGGFVGLGSLNGTGFGYGGVTLRY
jgi:hypothetical protein